MPTRDPDVEKEIKAQESEFEQLMNNQSFDRIADTFYTHDAKVLPPNAPPAEGRDQIKALFQELSETFSDVHIEADQVMVSDDLAIAQGTYTANVTTQDAETEQDHGTYVEVFRRENDGSWMCCMDTFSSNLDIPI